MPRAVEAGSWKFNELKGLLADRCIPGPGVKENRAVFTCPPQSNPDGYTHSSVMRYAEDLKGPLLIMHGMADDNVLFLHSTKLFRKLQDLGKPFDVMVYPGAKHGLVRQHDGRHAYATIKRFFDEKLQP